MIAEIIAYLAITGAALWWGLTLAPWCAWSTREHMEVSEIEINTNTSLSDITVLIAARNEADCIKITLDALHKQGAGLHIIVIDDQSTDTTAKLALQCGAKVVTGSAPPPSWSGKLWALEQGLCNVRSTYTLLLDADITLAPGILVKLLKKLRKEKLALVSLMAEPSLQNYIERLLMPAFVFFFKLLYPFSLANKPGSRIAAAAGGCIMLETRALHSTKAFASIHDALIDDCTLAAQLKKAGFTTWIGLSRAVRSHRGYLTLNPIWEMVARTAYTQLRNSLVLLITATVIMVLMFWAAPFALLWVPGSLGILISISSWTALFICYTPILRYYDQSLLMVLALPLIGSLYLGMTWASAYRYWRGTGAYWKGRYYGSKP